MWVIAWSGLLSAYVISHFLAYLMISRSLQMISSCKRSPLRWALAHHICYGMTTPVLQGFLIKIRERLPEPSKKLDPVFGGLRDARNKSIVLYRILSELLFQSVYTFVILRFIAKMSKPDPSWADRYSETRNKKILGGLDFLEMFLVFFSARSTTAIW